MNWKKKTQKKANLMMDKHKETSKKSNKPNNDKMKIGTELTRINGNMKKMLFVLWTAGIILVSVGVFAGVNLFMKSNESKPITDDSNDNTHIIKTNDLKFTEKIKEVFLKDNQEGTIRVIT